MGIVASLLGADNPLAQWTLANHGLLSSWGAGIAQGTNFGDALSNAARLGPAGQLIDQTYAKDQQEKADRAQAINMSAEALKKFPDLLQAVTSKAITPADAYSEMWKRMAPGYGHKYLSVGNGQVFDEATGKYVDMPDGGSSPPFDGTSMDAQVGNILLRGDPSTPDYAYAYQIASQPKITMQQTPNGLVPVYQMPDLSTVRKPTYTGPLPTQGMPPTSAPGAAAGGLPPTGMTGMAGGAGIGVGTALPGTKAPATESQARYGMLSNALTTDLPTVLSGYDALADPKAQALALGGQLTNWAQSADYQKASAALKASVGNIVYAISGANSTPQEQQRKIDEVTPQFGDKPATVAFKKQQLIAYVQGIAQASNDPDQKAKAEAILQALTAGDVNRYKQKYGLD